MKLHMIFVDFNTSHVNVNLGSFSLPYVLQQNFNTSHVNVNPNIAFLFMVKGENFNTSHVNVNHRGTGGAIPLEVISIHLMLMLIQ